MVYSIWETEKIGIAITGSCILMILINRIHQYLPCFRCWTKEATKEEVQLTTIRYAPESISSLEAITNFGPEELKNLYRDFKNECPHGVIIKKQFEDIFSQFFPNTSSEEFAGLVFNAFDLERKGFINFEEYAVGISALLRGSTEEKLQWIFQLYDVNNDGVLRKDEIHEVVESVHALLGERLEGTFDDVTIEEQTQLVFKTFNRRESDVIIKEEFFESCICNENFMRSLEALDCEI